MAADVAELKIAVGRLELVVDGDPDADVPGLRQRVKALEDSVAVLVKTDRERVLLLRGILLGLGLTAFSSIGTLIAVLRVLANLP